MQFNFIETAMAQAATTPVKSPSLVELLGLPAGFLAIMYFLVIYPQRKRMGDHRKVINSLKSGDEVYTSSGIIGRIRSVTDLFVTLDVAANTSIKVLKSNISGLTKGLEATSDKKATTST